MNIANMIHDDSGGSECYYEQAGGPRCVRDDHYRLITLDDLNARYRDFVVLRDAHAALLAAVDAVLEDYGTPEEWAVMSNMQTMIALHAARAACRQAEGGKGG